MTPLERACRVLCELDGNQPDVTIEGQPGWRNYLARVRAVLDAIHEPSLRMTEAGAEIIRYVGSEETPSGYQADAANVWRFMIGAAKFGGE